MISVKLPDGSTAQFPDGTPPETIKTAIQKKFPPQSPMVTLGKGVSGMKAPGNLDLNARKVFNAPDGSYRTENSISIGTDNGEVLIPTVVGGKQLSNDDAIAHFKQTGENLGTFASPDAADAYAQSLHLRQEQYYKPKTSAGPRAVPYAGPASNPMAQAPDAAGSSQPPASFDDNVRAFGANIDQIPGGNFVYGAMRDARAAVQGMTPDQVDAETAKARQAAPAADVAGKLFYNVAPYAMAGAVAPKLFGMGEALPITAGFKPVVLDTAGRAAAAAASNYAIGTADSIGRGQDPMQAAQANIVPSLAIGGLPVGGTVLRGAGRALPKLANWATGDIAPTIKAFWNPEGTAQKLVGKANVADQGSRNLMTPQDEALAQANGLNITNLDRGGPATASLARVAKNSGQAAETTLTDAVTHGPPGLDAANFLTKLVGGSADDIAFKQGVRDTGKLVNAPAYRKAYSAPAAQSIWTSDLGNMFQSDQFTKAVQQAEATGRTRAAAAGAQAVPNPFVFKTAPDGSVSVSMKPGVAPSLEFWDKVKINIDKQIEALGPTERTAKGELTDLKTRLVNTLDKAVPDYKTARQGAAGFFGADDMLEAGKQFASQPRNLPEAMAVLAKASPTDRKAFEIGWASSKVDALKSSPDFGVVKREFSSPASKELANAVLGSQRAGQLESYVKVLTIQNSMKTAVTGGSRTADWLIGAGIGGMGAVGNQMGVNPYGASTAAMLVGAARFGRGTVGRLVDKQVLGHVATLLASGDKAALTKVIANATLSPKWKAAIDAIFEGLAATARGATVSALGPTAAAAVPYPQSDTRDYSNGLPSAISQGPRISPMP